MNQHRSWLLKLSIGTLVVLSMLYYKFNHNVSMNLLAFQNSEQLKSEIVQKKIEDQFRVLYQTARTISLLPGVRNMNSEGSNLDSNTKWSIQQLYNNAFENIHASEIYIFPANIDPDQINPKTKKGIEPFLTFDTLIVSDNGEKKKDEDAGEKLEQVEVFEYRLMKEQMAYMSQKFPTYTQEMGLKLPVISGSSVVTCDNNEFTKDDLAKNNDEPRKGYIFTTPVYGMDGKLKGGVAVVIRNNIIRKQIPEAGITLVNTSIKASLSNDNTGTIPDPLSAQYTPESLGLPYFGKTKLDIKDSTEWEIHSYAPWSQFHATRDYTSTLQSFIFEIIVALVLAASLGFYLYKKTIFELAEQEKNKTLTSLHEAKHLKEKAEKAMALAEFEKKKAVDALKQTEAAKEEAMKQKQDAENSKSNAERAQKEALNALSEAEQSKAKAQASQLEAQKALQSAQEATQQAESSFKAAQASSLETKMLSEKAQKDNDTLNNRARVVLENVAKASAGDLTVQIPLTGQDPIGMIASKLNLMFSSLNDQIRLINLAVVELERTSSVITTVTEDIEATQIKTTDLVGAAAESSKSVVSSIISVTSASDQMAQSIQEINQLTAKSHQVVKSAEGKVQESTTIVQNLTESTNGINQVLSFIATIARQTNLLALNATIEAARAGDAGKGFAVVASEIKNLARETATATEQIGKSIATIQADSENVISSIGNINSSFQEITGFSGSIATAIEEQVATSRTISATMGSASHAIETITHNIDGVKLSANKTSQTILDSASVAQGLKELSGKLTKLAAQFKIDDTIKKAA